MQVWRDSVVIWCKGIFFLCGKSDEHITLFLLFLKHTDLAFGCSCLRCPSRLCRPTCSGSSSTSCTRWRRAGPCSRCAPTCRQLSARGGSKVRGGASGSATGGASVCSLRVLLSLLCSSAEEGWGSWVYSAVVILKLTRDSTLLLGNLRPRFY